MPPSRIQRLPGGLSGANAACHGFTGAVPDNGGLTLGSVKLFAIYWDSHYVNTPDAVTMFNQYLSTLINCSYMNALAQYGINRGEFLGSLVVDPTVEVPENPMSETQLQSHLSGWINSGSAPMPDDTHYDSLYIVFTPNGVVLTLQGLASNDPTNGFGGYHWSGHFNQFLGIGKESLFWAAIPWPPGLVPNQSNFNLATVLTPPACHEIVEAITDRNMNGWYVNVGSSQCELADICELTGPVTAYSWPVATFWSNADQTCIPSAPITSYLLIRSDGQLDSQGFPPDVAAKAQSVIGEGFVIMNIVFASNGGWLVIMQNNARWGVGFPQDVWDKLNELINDGFVLQNVVLAPNGGWLVLMQNNVFFASGFPQDTFDKMNSLVSEGFVIQNVVFAPNGSWLIIMQNNAWFFSGGFPAPVVDGIDQMISNGDTVVNVVFFPNWSALVIAASGNFVEAPPDFGFPTDVDAQLTSFITGIGISNLVVGPTQ